MKFRVCQIALKQKETGPLNLRGFSGGRTEKFFWDYRSVKLSEPTDKKIQYMISKLSKNVEENCRSRDIKKQKIDGNL